MPEESLTENLGTESTLTYTIDGTGFLSYGVYVSSSKGLLDLPEMKEPQTVNWAGSHGTVVDLAAPRYTNRTIELDCFIKTGGKLDFFMKLRTFLQLFQKPGLRKLVMNIADKPLIYMVYLANGVNISKEWRQNEMFGTFSLKLIEPSPVKRLLVRTGTTVSVSFASQTPIDIYWGDGTTSLGMMGDEVALTHDYATTGTYHILLCGVIEEIENFVTDAQLLWSQY